jgi:hypothetical protein
VWKPGGIAERSWASEETLGCEDGFGVNFDHLVRQNQDNPGRTWAQGELYYNRRRDFGADDDEVVDEQRE